METDDEFLKRSSVVKFPVLHQRLEFHLHHRVFKLMTVINKYIQISSVLLVRLMEETTRRQDVLTLIGIFNQKSIHFEEHV